MTPFGQLSHVELTIAATKSEGLGRAATEPTNSHIGQDFRCTGLMFRTRSKITQKRSAMMHRSTIRAALVGLVAMIAASSPSFADSGYVTLTIYKAGWIIGGSGGSGSLEFQGRYYSLSTGGLDYGFVFGASKTELHGRVSNIYQPSDVAGIYGAAGAGLAVGGGARAIVLTNEKGAVLELSGSQVGLLANLDLSGLAIALQ